MFGKSYSKNLVQFFSVLQRHQAAGITARDSIKEYASYCQDKNLKEILETIGKEMDGGDNIAEALSKHPDFCPPYVPEFLKIGIRNSQLDRFMGEIVESLQREEDAKKQFKDNLKGPMIMLPFLFIAFLVLVFFIIPHISKMFSSMKGFEMPLLTRGLIALGDILLHYNWVLALALVGIALAFNLWRIKFPERFDLLKLQVPIFGNVLKLFLHYNFARVFGLCIESGMITPDALQYTSMAISNRPYRNVLQEASKLIKNKGMTLPDAIEKADVHSIINPNFPLLFRAAARSGGMNEIMAGEAEHYHKDAVAAAESMNEQVGLMVSVPCYGFLILLLAAIEFPIWKAMGAAAMSGGM